jgi:threonine/homoserine/homoserine lactone efflux protein
MDDQPSLAALFAYVGAVTAKHGISQAANVGQGVAAAAFLHVFVAAYGGSTNFDGSTSVYTDYENTYSSKVLEWL